MASLHGQLAVTLTQLPHVPTSQNVAVAHIVGQGPKSKRRGRKKCNSIKASAPGALADNLSSRTAFSQSGAVQSLASRSRTQPICAVDPGNRWPQATAAGPWDIARSDDSAPSPRPASNPSSIQNPGTPVNPGTRGESLSVKAFRLSQTLRADRLKTADLHKIDDETGFSERRLQNPVTGGFSVQEKEAYQSERLLLKNVVPTRSWAFLDDGGDPAPPPLQDPRKGQDRQLSQVTANPYSSPQSHQLSLHMLMGDSSSERDASPKLSATASGVYRAPTPFSKPLGRSNTSIMSSGESPLSTDSVNGSLNSTMVGSSIQEEISEGANSWVDLQSAETKGEGGEEGTESEGERERSEGGGGPGLSRMVTKGGITWVRLVRKTKGDEGEEEEEEEEEKGPPLVNATAKKKQTNRGAARKLRKVREESKEEEEEEEEEEVIPETPLCEVESDDVDTVIEKIEMKYDIMGDEETVERNVRVLLGLGARKGQVMRVLAQQPDLLTREVHQETAELAEVLMNFSIKRVALLRALGKSLDWLAVDKSRAQAVLSYLDRELGVNNLGRVVAYSPHVLAQEEEEIVATVKLLRSIGVPDAGAVLERNPALLGWGAADVAEKVEVLESLVGARERVRAMLNKSSRVMGAGNHETREVYESLQSHLGADLAKEVVTRQPQVLAMDPGVVSTAVGHLIQFFGAAATGNILVETGSLVGRKWDATLAKIEFLLGHMERTADEVAAYPRVLGYNLKTRLRRRVEALQGAGGGTTESLRSLFGCSDAIFERRFGVVLPKLAKGKRGRKAKVGTVV